MKGAREGGEVFRDKTTDMGLLLRTCADYLHDSWKNITALLVRILTYWPENACLYIQIKGDFPLTPQGCPMQ